MALSRAEPIELRRGPLRLVLRPDLGACLCGLWFEGRAVLRSSDDPMGLDTARSSGGFALLPYSNRMAWGRFDFGEQAYTTAPNVSGMPHSLHGVGWRRAWAVERATSDTAQLSLHHRPDLDWPFALDAEQVIELVDAGLRLTLTVTNRHHRPAPIGLGWHPYFVRHPGSRLRAAVRQRWQSDPHSALPTRCEPEPVIDAEVERLDLDHCFEGWTGTARIDDRHHSMALHSSLDRLIVYTPPGREFFCVEPVSHVSNALNMHEPERHGVRVLEQAESVQAWMRLDIERAAALE